jgi:hypothetical protein
VSILEGQDKSNTDTTAPYCAQLTKQNLQAANGYQWISMDTMHGSLDCQLSRTADDFHAA